jgi:thioredoxin reductase
VFVCCQAIANLLAAQHPRHVLLIVRVLQVTVHFNTGVEDAFGDNVLEGLHLVDNATGDKRDLKVNGLFYGIGHQPNSKLVAGQIELDEAGYVKVRQCRGCAAAGCVVLEAGVWRKQVLLESCELSTRLGVFFG